MHAGMLWFDDTSKTFAEKVENAAKFYREKYNLVANKCYVHPSQMPESTRKDGLVVIKGVEICASNMIIKNHFWIGVRE